MTFTSDVFGHFQGWNWHSSSIEGVVRLKIVQLVNFWQSPDYHIQQTQEKTIIKYRQIDQQTCNWNMQIKNFLLKMKRKIKHVRRLFQIITISVQKLHDLLFSGGLLVYSTITVVCYFQRFQNISHFGNV